MIPQTSSGFYILAFVGLALVLVALLYMLRRMK
jgi:LPXTG-motif cell wall-anchored protein